MKRLFSLRDTPLLWTLIIFATALVLVPVVGVGLLSYARAAEIVQANSKMYQTVVLRELAKLIDVKVRAAEDLSRGLLADAEIQTIFRDANDRELSEFELATARLAVARIVQVAAPVSAGIASVRLDALSGQTYQWELIVDSRPPALDQNFVQLLREGDGAPVWLDPTPESSTIPLGRIVKDLDTLEPLGYLTLRVSEAELYSQYSTLATEVRSQLGGVLFIVNDRGFIISHPEKDLVGRDMRDGFPAAPPSFSAGGSPAIGLSQNSEYLLTSRRLDSAEWTIIGIVDRKALKRDVVAIRNWIALIASVLQIMATVVAVTVARSITLPIRRLAAEMQRIAVGDFRPPSPYESRNEVGLLYQEFGDMVREIDRLVEKSHREKVLLREAEIRSLIMQINPHFLYNALESINWMARLKGVHEVGDVTRSLADLMRETISGSPYVSVDRDIKNLENYLVIQKARYGAKFEVEFDIDDRARSALVPKLILQPLVENAIVHGIEPLDRPGVVRVEVRAAEDAESSTLTISVADNGVGMSGAKLASALVSRSSGRRGEENIGLDNVHKRVQLQYGPEYGLTVTSTLGTGTKAVVTLPFVDGSPT